MAIKNWILTLLSVLEQLVPPGEGRHHAILLFDEKIAINMQVLGGAQLYYLEDRDFPLPPQALAAEIHKLHLAQAERNGSIQIDPANVTVNGT